MKTLRTCDHTFKIHEERQITSRTRSVEVELLCGCTPDYFGPEILDAQPARRPEIPSRCPAHPWQVTRVSGASVSWSAGCVRTRE
jgi:hypothetical protein